MDGIIYICKMTLILCIIMFIVCSHIIGSQLRCQYQYINGMEWKHECHTMNTPMHSRLSSSAPPLLIQNNLEGRKRPSSPISLYLMVDLEFLFPLKISMAVPWWYLKVKPVSVFFYHKRLAHWSNIHI